MDIGYWIPYTTYRAIHHIIYSDLCSCIWWFEYILILHVGTFTIWFYTILSHHNTFFYRLRSYDKQHCVKSVQTRIYFWSVFYCIQSECYPWTSYPCLCANMATLLSVSYGWRMINHIISLYPFYTHWKHQKIRYFLMFSRGIERDNLREMC